MEQRRSHRIAINVTSPPRTQALWWGMWKKCMVQKFRELRKLDGRQVKIIHMPGCGWGSKPTCRRASYYKDLMHRRERTWASLPHTHTQTHIHFHKHIHINNTNTWSKQASYYKDLMQRRERGPELVQHLVTKTQIQIHISTYHRGGEGKRGSEELWVSPPHAHIENSAHWMLVHICPAYGWCLASKYSPHLTCNIQSLNRWLGCIWMTGPQTFTPFDLQCDLHPAWAIWELCINGWCVWNVWL